MLREQAWVERWQRQLKESRNQDIGEEHGNGGSNFAAASDTMYNEMSLLSKALLATPMLH